MCSFAQPLRITKCAGCCLSVPPLPRVPYLAVHVEYMPTGAKSSHPSVCIVGVRARNCSGRMCQLISAEGARRRADKFSGAKPRVHFSRARTSCLPTRGTRQAASGRRMRDGAISRARRRSTSKFADKKQRISVARAPLLTTRHESTAPSRAFATRANSFYNSPTTRWTHLLVEPSASLRRTFHEDAEWANFSAEGIDDEFDDPDCDGGPPLIRCSSSLRHVA